MPRFSGRKDGFVTHPGIHISSDSTANEVEMKICSKCLIQKDESMFSMDKYKSDGLCTVCKECRKSYIKKYYSENKYKIIEDVKKYRSIPENYEKVKKAAKERRIKNRDAILKVRRASQKARYSSDAGYRLNSIARAMVRRVFLRLGKEKDFGTFEKIGYSGLKLKQRLECQFKRGMTWDNFGAVWEIDHKIPISVLIGRGVTDVRIINALSNLQPMLVEENRSKGARYIG